MYIYIYMCTYTYLNIVVYVKYILIFIDTHGSTTYRILLNDSLALMYHGPALLRNVHSQLIEHIDASNGCNYTKKQG